MIIKKRIIVNKLFTIVGVLTALLCANPTSAQPYPNRPIKLIVPYAPGGNTDIVARIFGQKLSERIGQPVVFDNRGGATGTLGVGLAAKSPNDGGAAAIVEHHRLPDALRQLLSEDARHDVGVATGRVRHDQLDRPVRIRLCRSRVGTEQGSEHADDGK